MRNPPQFKILEAAVFSRQVKTRMPFQFGRSTLTQMPVIHLRLRVETDGGKSAIGVSASGIPPHWFDKTEGKTHLDNIHDLSLSLRLALDQYLEMGRTSIWFLHHIGEKTTRKLAAAKGLNELTAGFGVALIDSALIDAACRHAGATFHAALKSNILGMGSDFANIIPAKPLDRIALRHTIGLADPITAEDIKERIGDGLPETLEDVVREYRAGFFKIKISGNTIDSRLRLRKIANVLNTQAGEYRATLDGNEQFKNMYEFLDFIREASEDRELQSFWRRTLWIEQPVNRNYSLVDSVREPLKEISRFKPVIIDESDSSDEAVDQALSLGYRGISAKNCKGVFRTLHSFRRIADLVAQGKPAPILSSEDLTHTPIVPLHQDLCVAAALGISHSERNGHHYILGFDFLSPREREAALREFPSLYRTRKVGNPILCIENGSLNLQELNQNGFGTISFPDWAHLEPVELPPIPADLIDYESLVHRTEF